MRSLGSVAHRSSVSGTLAILVFATAAACGSIHDVELEGTSIVENPDVETGQPFELHECASNDDCFAGGPVCSEILGICEIPSQPDRGVLCGGPGRGDFVDEACICDEGFSDALVRGFCCALDETDPLCGNYTPLPGQAGGLCLAPSGTCGHESLTCNTERNVCLDPAHPCFGITCGGTDRGACTVDAAGQPQCACGPGFESETFDLYCCPVDGDDPLCV